MFGSPRQHHYVFGHVALRQVATADPDRFLAVFEGPDGGEFVRDLWLDVGRSVPPDDRIPDFGLSVGLHEVAGRTVVLVRCPEPEGTTECHLIAIVDVEGGLRYLTLEKGFSLGDDPVERTVLCEWVGERHCNYGDGPPAAEDGPLLDRIGDMLTNAGPAG